MLLLRTLSGFTASRIQGRQSSTCRALLHACVHADTDIFVSRKNLRCLVVLMARSIGARCYIIPACLFPRLVGGYQLVLVFFFCIFSPHKKNLLKVDWNTYDWRDYVEEGRGPAYEATLSMLDWKSLCVDVASFASTSIGKSRAMDLDIADTQARAEVRWQ